MLMSKTDLADNEYVAVYPLNRSKLAEYIKQARGKNRTMADFAKVCKAEDGRTFSPSTFSRIVKGYIRKPLSVELIRAIINSAEDPESLDFDAFMRANGMVPRTELEKQSFASRSEERRNTLELIKHTIADELYSRGCMLRIYPDLPRDDLPESGFYLHWLSRLAITVHEQEPKLWNFVVHYPVFDKYDHVADERRIRGNMEEAIRDWAFIFLRDMWEPEVFKDVKHSFVFTEQQDYDAFCGLMMKIKVNTCMSVIMIDTAKKRVVEEKMIPRCDREAPPSLFDLHKTNRF